MESVKFMLCFLIATITADAAVTLYQVETFLDFGGWGSGSPNPNPPQLLANSGPLGSGDFSLKITANGGSGAGGKLLAYNQSAWTGDYSGQGITSIAASLRNTGSTSLSIRFAFDGPGGWFVTTAAPVAAFAGWSLKVFDINPSSLLSAGGTDASLTMGAVTEIRVLHSNSVDYKGAQLSGSFLVDNIQAAPEPNSCMLLTLAGPLLFLRERRFKPSAP